MSPLSKGIMAATTAASTSATGGGGGGSSSGSSRREGSAKSMVADQISQTIQSTSNLLHLMLQSSPSQARLVKLPKNLLAKTSTIKNTEQVLEQLPRVISSLDAHMDSGLQSVAQFETVIQLLTNIENSQLKSLSKAPLSQQEPEPGEAHPEEKLKAAESAKATGL
ncbi:hypothetical protein LguiB_028586 [Lonicera macranthoides]